MTYLGVSLAELSMARKIMVVSTTNNSGKSLITAGLCRYFARRGWRVSPFQGETTTDLRYRTSYHGEISFLMAVQAWAAGVNPSPNLNPVLLSHCAQNSLGNRLRLSFKGKEVGLVTREEYEENYKDLAQELIRDTLQTLEENFDLLICDGQGTVSDRLSTGEFSGDLSMAMDYDMDLILVVHCAHGGFRGSLVGSLALMPEAAKGKLRGFILNQASLPPHGQTEAIADLETLSGLPCVGVVPPLPAQQAQRDLFRKRSPRGPAPIKVAVVNLPGGNSLEDLDPLKSEATVDMAYVELHESLGYPDAVILPNSRAIADDCQALHQSTMAQKIQDYVAAGGTILGLCGGFQLLGQTLSFPEDDGPAPQVCQGLGLIPMDSEIDRQKRSQEYQLVSHYPQRDLPVSGYYFLQGQTRYTQELGPNYQPLFSDRNYGHLGIVNQSQSVWGCAFHGLLDNGPWRRSWLNSLRHKRGLPSLPTGIINYREQRENHLNFWADTLEKYCHLDRLLDSQ